MLCKVDERAYLGNVLLKFEIGGAHPKRIYSCASVQGVLNNKCMKMTFFYLCKIHTCLSHTPGFLGHTTHYRVS